MARKIANELDVNPAPDIRIGQGRIAIKFRQLGASSWSETRRVEHAVHVAHVVRSLLADSDRWALRRRAGRAVVVSYEDAMYAAGCDIDARWVCVVPAVRNQLK